MSRVGTDPCPLSDDLQTHSAQRRGRDLGRSPGDRANLDPGQGFSGIGTVAGDAGHHVGRDRTPEIVDDDVDVACRLGESAYRSSVVEAGGGISSQVVERREPLSVASGADDMTGSKAFGDLHGHAT
jgi:hypothetical protein